MDTNEQWELTLIQKKENNNDSKAKWWGHVVVLIGKLYSDSFIKAIYYSGAPKREVRHNKWWW